MIAMVLGRASPCEKVQYITNSMLAEIFAFVSVGFCGTKYRIFSTTAKGTFSL